MREPLEILNNTFGHRDFRGEQQVIIERLLAGEHALVLMPTGMGKSLCYQIPALCLPDLTVVISPLIALMKDQVDGLKAKGVDAEFINSSLTRQEREARYTAVSAGQFKLLYVTPERFRKSEFVDRIGSRHIDLMAVDEAHCISEWGHDFRPDYTRIGEIRALLGQPTTVALTATATADVQRDIVRQLHLPTEAMPLYHHGIDRPNLSLDVESLWGVQEKLAQILRVREANPGRGIVYFTLIRTLETFSEHLQKLNVPHLCYHGQLERDQRRGVQEVFMEEPQSLVLATNAFGMGIDKEDIRFVIHAEVPGSMECYYQEIGRAGRDGHPSACCLLYEESDLETQMRFLEWSNPGASYYHRLFALLESRLESVNAFGLEWLREQLHHKQRGDRRLETALNMLDRHAVTEGSLETKTLTLEGELPRSLSDQDLLDEKKQRDMEKLYALVKYVQCDGDRHDYILQYFGLA